MIALARAAIGLILWGIATPHGWLATIATALLLHGAAVAIRAAVTAC